MLEVTRLRELLKYIPETGDFYWKKPRRGMVQGACAGTLINNGYIHIVIDGHAFKAHRLAWFYVNGVWPKQQIDHINGKRADNRICNLREAVQRQNSWN